MPITVLKNDKGIDAMRTEYARLYASTTSWGNIISINMGLPGLRAYWPMTSIDERGVVYDISGQGRALICVEGQ